MSLRTSSTLLLLAVAGPLSAQDTRTAPSDPDVVARKDGKVAARLVARQWDPKEPRATCKVYHHLFAPDGRQLTKGEGGKFEHHRGLFVGWNKTSWGEHKADFWHMTNGVRQELGSSESPTRMGLGVGGQHLEIRWRAGDQTPVIERRGLDVIEESAQHHVLRMRVALRAGPADTTVTLAGDPQHAGQQLRALQQFAEDDAEPVRYLRPEGSKEHGNDVWTACDWTAAVLPLPAGPVTVLRVESPFNAGKPTWSTRPYGRFGSTRKLTLPARKAAQQDVADMPWVLLEFYYVVALGEQDREWCARHAERLRKATKDPRPDKR